MNLNMEMKKLYLFDNTDSSPLLVLFPTVNAKYVIVLALAQDEGA